ncbi:zinc ribbon domain-containing protein [Candidatus Bathyarchaeota archaeon]|nr:zinc ribbon domain-containing protein [Candidatus Bathyarchaeota archaeon]MBS7633098.1 zinc ribbon domain-containing protein [Candidatus Bathyarchaeota archaeon]
MPFCLKCGRKLSDGAMFCVSCIASSTVPLRKSHVGRKILLGFVLLDLVAAGGLMFYLFQ